MKKKDLLINLINSLNPNEQRNFKMYSSMLAGDKAYMKLYDALEGKDDYDATTLSEKLNISKGLLAERKNYLSHVLLLSLRNFQNETPEAAGRRNVDEATLLIGRRQFNYALSIAENALAKAWQTEHFEIIAQLLQIKARCLNALENTVDSDLLMTEHVKAIALESELLEISVLRMSVNRMEVSRNSRNNLDEVLNNKLMANGFEKLSSLRAQIDWFDIMVRCYHISFSQEAMYKLCVQETKHYLKHLQVKIIDPIAYVKSFSSLAAAQFNLRNFKGALISIRKFEQALNDPSVEINSIKKASLKYYGTMFNAHVLRLLGRNSEAMELNKKCYAERHQRPTSEQYSVIYELALTHFNLGNIDEADTIIEELLTVKDDVRYDLQQTARYLKMMIQMDLGNYQLIPYAVKSAKGWLKQRKIDELPEVKLFFTHMLAVAKAPALERKHQWAQFKKPADEGRLDMLDSAFSLNAWLNSKTKV